MNSFILAGILSQKGREKTLRSLIEPLESRLQFSTISYGVATSGDPSITGVLNDLGPGLKDLGARGVRLFTNTSFLSSDFDTTPSGKIYVRNPALVQSLSYARQYHDAGIDVTLCIQLSTDRSMSDGSLLSRRLAPTELRSPKVFRTWYDTLSKAQISKSDHTSVTKVLDFWEIGNEPNLTLSVYWPSDYSQPDHGIAQALDSYVDHDLIPAYDVLSKLHEPVIGAALASATVDQWNQLNNQPGSRHHQYSDHVDYLNVHPYGYLNTPDQELTPQAEVQNFTGTIYDGTVTKPFVITEYNLSDFGHSFTLDPDPNPRDAAEQEGVANDLDAAHTALIKNATVKAHCAWIYYYRLVAQERTTRGALFYPRPDGKSPCLPLTPLYSMFKRWTAGSSTVPAPTAGKGVLTLDQKSVINAIAVQKDGKTLVVSDDGVRRYDSAGKLDPTYGVKGFAALPFIGKAAALQGDGNLVVGGVENDLTHSFHLEVTRLSTAGRIDTGFGTAGYFALKDHSGSEARDIALRAGKIVIIGRNRSMRDGVLLRLDLTGQLDASFAGGGLTIVKNSGPFSDVVISKSGAITTLLTPYLLSPSTSVVRFTKNGKLDKTFADDGFSDPAPVIGDGLFVDPDGGVQMVAHYPIAPKQAIIRYRSDGQLDTAFGVEGISTLSASQFMRGSPVELPDGSRYLYGSISAGLISDSRHIFVGKLTTAGAFDGKIRTFSSGNIQDLPFDAAIDPDGSMTIVAGVYTKHNEAGLRQELFLL